MSTRETIFAALITRLEGVTVANGYATDVNSPVDKNVQPSTTRTVPAGDAYVANFDEGDSDVIAYFASNKALLESRFMVRAAIRSTQHALIPTAIANNWIGDMRELVYTINANPTSLLSANARSVVMGAFSGWIVSDMDAVTTIPFTILHWIDQAAP